MPTLEEETPRGQQRDRERQCRGAADEVPELGVSLLDRTQTIQRGGVEQLRGYGEDRQVGQAGKAERDHDVEALEADQPGALVVVAAWHSALGERGVQVDRVRHHGCADDPDGDVERAGAVQAGDQAVQRAVGRRSDPQRLVQEAEEDHRQQCCDRQLEPAKPSRLQLEDRECHHSGYDPRRQQGNVK